MPIVAPAPTTTTGTPAPPVRSPEDAALAAAARRWLATKSSANCLYLRTALTAWLPTITG